MNLRGSYRALRNNSKAAMLAAIEIYNKPQIEYRDECFIILLINAWELLLKAILSKNKQSIYYTKDKKESYRTYSVQEALVKAKRYFSSHISFEPVAKNLDMLIEYRNNAIHFYNQKGFSVVVYSLAQTSIINFKDLMHSIFNIDISNEMTISLLPLSFGGRPDPIEFLNNSRLKPMKNKAVAQYLKNISQATNELESKNLDTVRFLTVFTVNLQSVKKVSSADVVVGINSGNDGMDTVIIQKSVDPNISHPLRLKEVIARVSSEIAGIRITTYTFQAIAWKYGIKNKPHLCWQSSGKELIRYSAEVPAFIRGLTKNEIEEAKNEYKEYQHQQRKRSDN